MMPMYMNSSQQGQIRPQGHYHHHHQGFETNNPHHHMPMDDAPCGYWPTPPQSLSPCYGSCIHGNNFPTYQGYWPACYPSQVPYHHPCCMNRSGFYPHAPPCYSHQPFPVSYQPVYESEKEGPGKHHCAKCSPLPRGNRGVVIEEHEPEIDKGDHGEAVQSVRSSNFPYPIIWIPHENAMIQESHDHPPEVQRSDPKSWNGCFPLDESALKSLMHNQQDRNKMQSKRTVEFPFDVNKLKSLLQGQGSKVQENGSGSHDQPPTVVKDPENMKIQKSDPRYMNGCFPFDESTLKSLLQNQEKKKSENGKSVELPFDISKLKSLLQGQDGKEVQSQKNKEESEQHPYPVFWIPSHGKGEDVEATESMERTNEGKEGLARTIPVENHLQEPRNIPVKLSSENHLQTPIEQTKGVTMVKPVEKTKKVQSSSSSSPKASRLPPVCLRVDPLPKRKNGGSKSLSPPRRKEQEETKVASPLSSKKAESKTVPEACNVKSKEMKESVESISNLREGANSIKESTEKSVKKTFTDEEGARIIQSRYRGYDVRRWEPLKKLKEIATVREQMGYVEKRVQALEASSSDNHIEEKEIIVLEETVMNLLIKLDSIQGLHHSIREHRKSLARELSEIEEKLDSLKKSIAMIKEEAVEEQVEISSHISDFPVNVVEQSQLEEENKDISDSKDTEKVLLPPPEEHDPMSFMNGTVEQLTSLMDPVSANGNGVTVTNSEDDKVMVENLEDPLRELPQVVETESYEDRKEEDETRSSSEKVVELLELPVGVIDSEASSCTREEETTAMDSEVASKEETQVSEHEEVSEEAKRLKEENQRFKETVETLVKAGSEQLEVISKLTGRVKSLEKKLSQKRKKKNTHIIKRRGPNRGKHGTKPNQCL